MPLRPCLDCGTPGRGTRCPTHQAQRQRAKDARRPQRRSHAEQQRRRQAVADHVATYGWVCPGWQGHPPHPSHDLTAHHADAVGAGGSEHGPLVVVCRSLNSSIGSRTDAGHERGQGARMNTGLGIAIAILVLVALTFLKVFGIV
jgi:hypothetical protein